MDALAGLAGHAHRVIGGDGELVLDLQLDLVGMRGGEVDLVDGGHDVEVRVHGEVRVGDRLRLDALRGVDDEHGALAGRQRAGDLVGEVHVPRRVDEVELVGLPVVGRVGDAHRVALDGDAALALDVHRVEQLRLHIALGHGVGELEDAVGDGRLAMVDVGDDGEVPDVGDALCIHAPHDTRYPPPTATARSCTSREQHA